MRLALTLSRLAVSAAVAAAGLLTLGCGGYEPEAHYPGSYAYEAPRPLSSEELAQQRAQIQARAQANDDAREILIGADGEGTEYSDVDPSALTEFKPALDGHGAWVEDGTYGTVWVPSQAEVGTDFQPYVTAGHWTYSDEADYVWVSDYSWGWAPFHYGRWVHLPGHGWSWIPGRRYAGAWVTWRVGPAGYGYVGWAPAPPSWYWYRGAAYGWHFGFYHHHDHYVYCPRDYVYHGGVGSHVVRGPAAQEHFGRTQDYVPPAAPSRVVASPTVAGAERTLASPAVGPAQAGAGASPRIGSERRGPRPDELGIQGEAVVAPPSSHPGLDRARAIANVQPVVRPAALDRGPATSAYVPPSNGGRPIPAQPYRSPSESVTSSRPPHFDSYARPSPPSSSFGASTMRPSSPSVSAFRSEARPIAPSYRPPPTFRSSPPSSVSVMRSSPSPTFRSSPSVSSSPTFRPSSPSVSAFRSAPTPTFRAASPSVSSSPTFRSSPSRSVGAIRSSPSVRATPSVRSSTVMRSKR